MCMWWWSIWLILLLKRMHLHLWMNIYTQKVYFLLNITWNQRRSGYFTICLIRRWRRCRWLSKSRGRWYLTGVWTTIVIVRRWCTSDDFLIDIVYLRMGKTNGQNYKWGRRKWLFEFGRIIMLRCPNWLRNIRWDLSLSLLEILE